MTKDEAIQFAKGLYSIADKASVTGQVTRGIDALMPELLEYLDKAEIPEDPTDED